MSAPDIELPTALHLEALSKIHSLCLPHTASHETKRVVRYLETHLQGGPSLPSYSAAGAANSSNALIMYSNNARGRITYTRGPGLWENQSFARTSKAGNKRRGPLGLRLKKLLPNHHATLNERCWKCGILAVPGVNATYQTETEELKKERQKKGKKQQKCSSKKAEQRKLIRKCLHCGAEKAQGASQAKKKGKSKQPAKTDERGLANQSMDLDSSLMRMDTSDLSIQHARNAGLPFPTTSTPFRLPGYQGNRPQSMLRQVFSPHTPSREGTPGTPAEEQTPSLITVATASTSSTEAPPAQKFLTLDQIAALKKKENKRKRKEMERGDVDTSSPAPKMARMAEATVGDESSISLYDVERHSTPSQQAPQASREGSLEGSNGQAQAGDPNPLLQSVSTAIDPKPMTPPRPMSLDERAALAKAEKKRLKKEAKMAAAGTDAGSSSSGNGSASTPAKPVQVSPFGDKSALKAMLQADKERKKSQSSSGSSKPQSGLRNVFG